MFEGVEMPDDMYPTHTTYGDGTEIEPEVIQHIRDTNWSTAVGFEWQDGDVLIIDNVAVMHGRISFSGERKILSFLTKN
jgi:alpha-ketoglutarate-dependent taurine dioxygenase